MAEAALETARLRLEPWRAADSEPLGRVLNTPAVTRWLGGVATREAWAKFAEERLSPLLFRGGVGGGVSPAGGASNDRPHPNPSPEGEGLIRHIPTFVLRRHGSDEALGIVGLNRVRAAAGPLLEGRTEIFWRLAEFAWGRGYAREAAEAVLTHGFTDPTRADIVAFTVPQNHASWGLMQRIGMTRWRDADFDHPEVADPAIVRHIVYSMTRGEWQA